MEDKMTRTNMLAAALAAAVLAAPVAATAQTATPNIDQRQANQEKRIDQGVASGALNKREANRMKKQQTRIDGLENRAKADGTVTKRERAKIAKTQSNTSKRIYRQKHDAQVRPQ